MLRIKRRTMRRILVPLSLMVMWLGVAAAAAPQIAVDLATYSFPDTVEGMAVVHTFVLSNVGDQELVIESVEPSCACTMISSELATARLQPGQSADLRAVLDTNGSLGAIRKELLVTSNDPGKDGDHELVLSFKGTVVRRLPHQESVGDLFYAAYILIDVRAPGAYVLDHLIGALNVPANRASSLAAGLPPSATVILYDETGATSTIEAVAQALYGAGISAVYYVNGGLTQWQESYGTARMTSGSDVSWGGFLDVSGVRTRWTSSAAGRYYVAQLLTDYVLIDLRTSSDFAAAHLAGAVNVSEAGLAAFVETLRKETPIVVYSADGTDSDRAASALWQRGIKARSLLGGLAEWQKLYGSFLLVASAG
jgi:rhodanese-related sulfurtransferase